MNKHIFKVTKFEITRQLKKPAFWAATLLIPLLIGFIYFISFVSSSEVNQEPTFDENTKIAITDNAKVLSNQTPYLIKGDKTQGIEMVKNGEADYYFYIPPDFTETKKAEFYHISNGLEIFNNNANILRSILTSNASTHVDTLDVIVLTNSYEVEDHKITTDGSDTNALGKAIIPFFIGILFFMFIALCGNRFLMTVVEEKENRISEMILTSISSKHLIIGKIISLLILGFIQIAVLATPVLIIAFLNRDSTLLSPILSIIEINPLTITLSVILFLASSIFYAGVCTFVGSLVSTARDASSFIGPTIIVMVLPLYFMQLFMATEPNLLVQFFTYFPFSAPIALMLRNGFGTLSTLEFCLGIIIVIISASIAIHLAIHSFQKNSINFNIALPKFLRTRKK